jgi:hypothetical protein
LEGDPQHTDRALRRPDRRQQHQLNSMTATATYTRNLPRPSGSARRPCP